MAIIALADPSIIVNNEPVSIVPNSFKYDEGDGEQKMRSASTGGGSVQQVFSNDIETKFSDFSFEIYPDITSINDARAWKKNLNRNVVVATGKTPDGKSFRRTFKQAAILGRTEIPLGADTTITLEFSSSSAV